MKTKAKHTPGPWFVSAPINGEDITVSSVRPGSGNRQYIGRVYNSGILASPDPELTANALLIAAAPQLLALVKQFRALALDHDMDASVIDEALRIAGEEV